MYRVNLCDLSHTADPATSQWLLPAHLRRRDDAERQAVYREALLLAMEEYLTEEQREAFTKRFLQRKGIAEIGAETGVTPSAASKRIAAATRILKERIGFCVRLYDTLSLRRNNVDAFGE